MKPYMLFTFKCNKCETFEEWNLTMLNDYAAQYDGKDYVKKLYRCSGTGSCRGTLVLKEINREVSGGGMRVIFPN
jgi:hypothetical protein